MESETPASREQQPVNIEQLLEKTKTGRESAPEIQIAPEEKAQATKLLAAFDAPGQHVLGVVRCWNKTKKDIAALLERIKSMRQELPELTGVMVVVNAEGEQKAGGETQNNVRTARTQEGEAVLVATLLINGYSWTAGLNAPTALLYHYCRAKNLNLRDQSLLNISFDAEFDRNALQKVAAAVRENKPIVTRRKEPATDTVELSDQSMAHEIRKWISSGTLPADEQSTETLAAIAQALSMARNTATVARLADVVDMGGFDARCNETGGVEDQDFIVRRLLLLLHLSDTAGAKALWKSLKQPIEYRDAAWDNLPVDKKKDKIAHETRSIRTMAERLSRVQAPEGLITPDEFRDFKLSDRLWK